MSKKPKKLENTEKISKASENAVEKVIEHDPVIEAWKWFIAGHNKADIMEALASQFPGCNPQQTIIRALEAFALAVKEPREIIDGYCLESYRTIHRKCMEAGDYSGALAAVKEIARLNDKNKAQMSVAEYMNIMNPQK